MASRHMPEPEMEAPGPSYSRLRSMVRRENLLTLAIIGAGSVFGGGGTAMVARAVQPAAAQAETPELQREVEQLRRTVQRQGENELLLCAMVAQALKQPNPCQRASWGPE